MCSKVGMMEGSWEVWLWLHCWWLQVLLSFSLNFSFLLWLHAFQHHTSLHSRAFSDSLKFLICGLTSKSFGINSPYESLKFAEKFSLSGLPFLITRALHIHLLAAWLPPQVYGAGSCLFTSTHWSAWSCPLSLTKLHFPCLKLWFSFFISSTSEQNLQIRILQL